MSENYERFEIAILPFIKTLSSGKDDVSAAELADSISAVHEKISGIIRSFTDDSNDSALVSFGKKVPVLGGLFRKFDEKSDDSFDMVSVKNSVLSAIGDFITIVSSTDTLISELKYKSETIRDYSEEIDSLLETVDKNDSAYATIVRAKASASDGLMRTAMTISSVEKMRGSVLKSVEILKSTLDISLSDESYKRTSKVGKSAIEGFGDSLSALGLECENTNVRTESSSESFKKALENAIK